MLRLYDEFYPHCSRPIIDAIDRVLAQHYDFTAEELDFITNYDTVSTQPFRMFLSCPRGLQSFITLWVSPEFTPSTTLRACPERSRRGQAPSGAEGGRAIPFFFLYRFAVTLPHGRAMRPPTRQASRRGAAACSPPAHVWMSAERRYMQRRSVLFLNTQDIRGGMVSQPFARVYPGRS